MKTAREKHVETLLRVILSGKQKEAPVPEPPGPEPDPRPIAKEELAVNYYDWDGRLLYAYTPEEALALAEMPAIPEDPEGVLCNGTWNWSLADMKAQVTAAQICDVGAIYDTADGATYLDVELCNAGSAAIRTNCSYAAGADTWHATVDWGDGTINDYAGTDYAGITYPEFAHTYSAPGAYTIKIAKGEGMGTMRLGHGDVCAIFPRAALTRARIGWPEALGNGCGLISSDITALSLPHGAAIGRNAFDRCGKLPYVGIPSDVTIEDTPAFVGLGIALPGGCLIAQPAAAASWPSGAAQNCVIKSAPITTSPLFPASSQSVPIQVRLGQGGRVANDPWFPKALFLGGNDFGILSSKTDVSFGYEAMPRRVWINPGSTELIITRGLIGYLGDCVLHIPDTVTVIKQNNGSGSYQPANFFADCREIHVHNATPPTLSQYMIRGDTPVYVPAESVPAYNAATNWSALNILPEPRGGKP